MSQEGFLSEDVAPSDGSQEQQELSFDQQEALAEELMKVVDARNAFVQRQGGFDTFAEVGQHVQDMRSAYDEMENTVTLAMQDFEQKVIDKKAFVKELRNRGNDVLADVIASMFSVPKDNIFSRLFKK